MQFYGFSYFVSQFEVLCGEITRRIKGSVLCILNENTMEIVFSAISNHFLSMVIHTANLSNNNI
jgi:hypothetical protein